MNRKDRGFTLVEMLVALSVAALLAGLVYGAVRVGQRSAAALGIQADSAEAMRIGWQFLHDSLSRARTEPDPVNPGNRTGFHGTRERLSFVADMPAHMGIGGLMRITVSVEPGDDGRQLVLMRQRLEPSAASVAAASGEQAVLVDHLERLQIAYFGQLGRRADPTWHPNWNDPRTLPNLIHISVKPTNAPGWPLLIASPLTGAKPVSEPEPVAETPTQASPDGVRE